MSEDLNAAISALLSGRLRNDRSLPDIKVRALILAGEECRIEVTLAFEKDVLYCCFEPGCFVDYYAPRLWVLLRQQLAELGLADPPFPMTMRINGIVQAGSLFTVDSTRQVVAAAGEYTEECAERRESAGPVHS